MSIATPRKSTWPRQTAIVVSDSPNVHMLLRELLRSYQWTVVDSTPSVERATALVRQGQAYLVIVDDSLALPAVKQIRYLLSDAIATCTPVLSFLLEAHKLEIPALARMGRPVVVDKPLTPSKFVPGFVALVKAWEKEPFVTLRKANYHFVAGNDELGLRMLAKLSELDAARPFAVPALALHLRRVGRVKDAETALLLALKKSPRELGMMIALSDLYMHAAMPRLAHRLLMGSRTTYSQSMAVVPDLVQANLLMGNTYEAIAHLYVMLKAEYMQAEVTDFLARLLFAEGRESEAERVLNNNKAAFSRIQNGWTNAENVGATQNAEAPPRAG